MAKVGPAIVLHNGPLTHQQRLRVALIGHGPRAVLSSFTALRGYGLRNWDRESIYVQNEIIIGGAVVLRFPSVTVRNEPELVIAQLRRVLLQH